MHGQQHIKKRP